jgi:hypothetical protein
MNSIFYTKNIRFFAVIFIYLSFFNFLQAIYPQRNPDQEQREYDIAVEMSRHYQKGILSQEQAAKILLKTFENYSDFDTKISSVLDFVSQKIEIRDFIVQLVSEQRDCSVSDVYCIKDSKTKQAQFFVKVFPYDSKYFLYEVFGLSIMKDIRHVHAPRVYGFGQSVINEKRYFFILETAVKGISIQQHFHNVGIYPRSCKESQQYFEELCEAVQACGTNLAIMHGYFSIHNQAFPQEAEDKLRQDLNEAIEELTNCPQDGIEIEKLQAFTNNIIQKMKAEKHLTGLVYDDINTIHTFYDFEHKEFSLINPHCLFHCFNSEGTPKGLLVEDICKYLLSLTFNRFEYSWNKYQNVLRKELLTEQEIETLKSIFEMTYAQNGGILPSPLEREYALLKHDLFFIKKSRLNLPEPELTRVKDLINISVASLRTRLKDF